MALSCCKGSNYFRKRNGRAYYFIAYFATEGYFRRISDPITRKKTKTVERCEKISYLYAIFPAPVNKPAVPYVFYRQ